MNTINNKNVVDVNEQIKNEYNALLSNNLKIFRDDFETLKNMVDQSDENVIALIITYENMFKCLDRFGIITK